METKRGLKSPLEAKIQKNDPIGFFYEQKCPFDENLVYLAQKLSKPLPNVFRDFDLGIPFFIFKGIVRITVLRDNLLLLLYLSSKNIK